MVIPSQKAPIMVALTETYGTEADEGDKVVELLIQPDTHESFYVEESNDFDFDL